MDTVRRAICNFVRATTGGDVGVTATQIAQGTGFKFGRVCNQIHWLVMEGYLRRLYLRPALYQWTGRPLSALRSSSAEAQSGGTSSAGQDG